MDVYAFLILILAIGVAAADLSAPSAPIKLLYYDTNITVGWNNSFSQSFNSFVLEMSAYNDSSFKQIYKGPFTQFLVDSLIPLTFYYFRLKGVGVLGVESPYSPTTVISTSGTLVSYVGSYSQFGSADGVGISATFDTPRGMSWDPRNGNLYIATLFSKPLIRLATPFSKVTTLPHHVTTYMEGSNGMCGLALDPENNQLFMGNLYMATMWKVPLDTYGGEKVFINNSIVNPTGPTWIDYNAKTKTLHYVEINLPMIRRWKSPFTDKNDVKTITFDINYYYHWGYAVDSVGNYYLGTGTAVLKFENSTGKTSLFIGNSTAGYSDGKNALLHSPEGIAIGPDDSLYTVDNYNNVIRRTTTDGYTTTVAGTLGAISKPFSPGAGSGANLAYPRQIYAHPVAPDFFYIADGCGIRILYARAPPAPVFDAEILQNGTLTIHWNPVVPVVTLTSCIVDVIYKSGRSYTSFTPATWNETMTLNSTIMPDNSVVTINMFSANKYGPGETTTKTLLSNCAHPMPPTRASYSDNSISLQWASLAPFSNQYVLEMSKTNSSFVPIYYGDDNSYTAKSLLPLTNYYFRLKCMKSGPNPYSDVMLFSTSGTVKSFVGSFSATSNGSVVNGFGTNARFNDVTQMVRDPRTGDLYAAVDQNRAIARITPFGNVTTLELDASISLDHPYGLALDVPNNLLYVSQFYDAGINLDGRIVAVSLDNLGKAPLKGSVLLSNLTTIADDAKSLPRSPSGLLYDSASETLYFSEFWNSGLRKWKRPSTSNSGDITSVLLSTQKNTWGFTMDSAKNLYVGKFSQLLNISGNTTLPLAGSNAQLDFVDGPSALFNLITGVALGSDGSIYVVDSGNQVIRRVSQKVTSTVAGMPGTWPFLPGTGPIVHFMAPTSIYSHPEVPDFFYIGDQAGIRLMYSTRPPKPSVTLSINENNNQWTVSWNSLVPTAAITSLSINVSIPRIIVYAENTTNPTPTFTGNFEFPPQVLVTVTLMVTNEYGDSDVATVITFANPLSVNVRKMSCHAANDAQITISAVPSYFLVTVNHISGRTFTNLIAGDYTWRIVDPSGYWANTTGLISISEPAALVVSVTASVDCLKQNSSVVDYYAIGGTPPYRYLLDSKTSNSPQMKQIKVGEHLWSVIDSNGCSVQGNVNVSQSCGANAYCANTGIYQTCNCSVGFIGDGLNCTDVDECAGNPCPKHLTCFNEPGSYSCSPCPRGYQASGNDCIDIDECASNNGGCDYHVNCTNTNGSFECGKCPEGLVGDGFTCITLCGNGVCEPEIGETCVSCKYDCPQTQCNLCGDRFCNATIGENCTTCYEDCGACYQLPCPGMPYCSGNGTCNYDTGTCKCFDKFIGSDCSQVSKPVNTNVTNNDPGVTIIPLGAHNITFVVTVNKIREVTAGGDLVQEINAPKYTLKTAKSTKNSANQIWVLSSTLENNARLELTICQFEDLTTKVLFVNETIVYPQHSLKITVMVANWPFRALTNAIELVFATSVATPTTCTNVAYSMDTQKSLQWMSINVDGTAMYGEFLQLAQVDETIRQVSVSLEKNNDTVVLRAPHFWYNLTIDTTYSVLDQEHPNPACSIDSNEITHKTAVIMIPVVVGLVIIAVAIIILVYRLHSWWIASREYHSKRNSSGSQLLGRSEFEPVNTTELDEI